MQNDEPRRHSVAEEAELITDEKLLSEAEARNGLMQFDMGMAAVEDAIAKGEKFKLRSSLILGLHRVALAGISSRAGSFRPAGVRISKSSHEPIGAHLVAENVEDMCDYINERLKPSFAIHLSAYAMWRLNWIHPFTDGNGRTSRIFSYIVLCIATGSRLPGDRTIPDFIVDNRKPYFDALEAADNHLISSGKIDVRDMEKLLSRLLAKQFLSVIERASGKN